MSTFSAAKNLELVARAGDVGTWDTPTNSNWSVVDACLGQNAVIPLNNSNVALSFSQAQCGQITFSSTLTGSVLITFPTSYTGPYIIQNLCTGTSAFTITLQTSAGGQVVGCPQGDSFNVINDGTNLKFHNIGRVGSYWDYAGSSVPNWVSACTVPPWLNCDGTTFSGATYPSLATILAGTTLPDMRGTVRATLNQGTGRMTNVINASSVGVLGGADTLTLATSQIPSHTHANFLSDPGHAHSGSVISQGTIQTGAGGQPGLGGNNTGGVAGVITVNANVTGASVTNAAAGGGGSHGNVQPTTIGGITMIRSA